MTIHEELDEALVTEFNQLIITSTSWSEVIERLRLRPREAEAAIARIEQRLHWLRTTIR